MEIIESYDFKTALDAENFTKSIGRNGHLYMEANRLKDIDRVIVSFHLIDGGDIPHKNIKIIRAFVEWHGGNFMNN